MPVCPSGAAKQIARAGFSPETRYATRLHTTTDRVRTPVQFVNRPGSAYSPDKAVWSFRPAIDPAVPASLSGGPAGRTEVAVPGPVTIVVVRRGRATPHGRTAGCRRATAASSEWRAAGVDHVSAESFAGRIGLRGEWAADQAELQYKPSGHRGRGGLRIIGC